MDIPMSAKHISLLHITAFRYMIFFKKFLEIAFVCCSFFIQEERFSQFPETAQSYALVLMAIVKRLYDILLPLAV